MLQVCHSNTALAHRHSFVGDMAEQWVKELKDIKVVDAIKVETTKNLADMLTKCLTYPVRNALEGLLKDMAKSLAKAQAI